MWRDNPSTIPTQGLVNSRPERAKFFIICFSLLGVPGVLENVINVILRGRSPFSSASAHAPGIILEFGGWFLPRDAMRN